MVAWMQGAGASLLSLVVETPAGYALFLAVVWGTIFLVLQLLLALGRPRPPRNTLAGLRAAASGVKLNAGSRDGPTAAANGYNSAHPRAF